MVTHGAAFFASTVLHLRTSCCIMTPMTYTNHNSKRAEQYEKIVAALESMIDLDGLLPWQKSWTGATWARSMSTGKEYNGANRWLLTTLSSTVPGYSQWWGTYDQIQALGGQVRKDEKHTKVFWWAKYSKKDAKTGEEKSGVSLKYFRVFNAGQADGLPAKYFEAPAPKQNEELSEPQAVFEGYVASSGVTVRHGGDRACYRPSVDVIDVPDLKAFTSSEHYYAVLFHECGHSTGAKSRLNREGVTNLDSFGSHQYSREELIAELSSALVLGDCGIVDPTVQANQAAYLKAWKSALRSDPGAFMWAASRAEKAANLVLGVVEAERELETAVAA